MNKAQSTMIFERFAANNPNPTTELQFNSSFELLIAVMLSAQATDVSVNKATVHLFQVANTPTAILGLGEERLAHYIKVVTEKTGSLFGLCARYGGYLSGAKPEIVELLVRFSEELGIAFQL
ncbi:MAG: endonuclease III, partial [Methylocystaceae bacterium]|nr:endonuclease III [Methylocystaceae bacterium]